MRRREPLPRRGGSGSRFVRRQSRRASKPGKRRARRRCGVRRRGLGPWFYRLDRSRFPAGGNGSRSACRQSRRASKPGKQRAQRAECQKAGQRPAFSRRARRRCGVRRRGLGLWFYRLDGNRSLQRGNGSRSAYRQSRRASKPGKQRAQRAECQKAGQRPAFSRRARRRCGVRRRGLGLWFYRLDGNRSLQRGNGSRSAYRQSRRASKPGKQRAQRAESREGAWPGPPRRQRLPFLSHSALRSTSSPSGPCAICWKPAFSYRRTGPA